MSRSSMARSLVGALCLGVVQVTAVPTALAQQWPGPVVQQVSMSETATITSSTAGQRFADPFGNTLYVGSVHSGPIVGSPLNGTFRFEGDFQVPAGSALGEFQGTFVASDSGGNVMYGNMQGAELIDAFGNAMLNGRFNVAGGTGIFVNADGSGEINGLLDVTPNDRTGSRLGWTVITYSGVLSLGGPNTGSIMPTFSPIAPNPAFTTSATQQLLPNGTTVLVLTEADDEIRPGYGFGDDNHVHTKTGDDNRGRGQGRHGRD